MSQNRVAGITGIRGQDGSFLARYLLDLGYDVVGLDRRSGGSSYWRHEDLEIKDKFKMEYVDITEYESVRKIFSKYKFDEFYNLAAESFVQTSFDHPFHILDVNTAGHLNILEVIRHYSPDTKLYFASSSETFGKVQEIPQTEKTPFYPRSPYGISKLCSFWFTKNYRESYNLKCCSGILFNHESALRGEEFVTRKITTNIAKWFYNRKHTFQLGNLDAKRDWGYSWDYVKAMNLMLQQETFDDYVIATNEAHSIREFIVECCNVIACEVKFVGSGIDEKVYINDDLVITINEDFYRPAEVDILIGDYSKAKKELGWYPETSFKTLVEYMMEYDLNKYDQKGIK